MSRVGKNPVVVPKNVKIQVSNGSVQVEGPNGKLDWSYHPNMRVQYDEGKQNVTVERPNDERLNRSLHGLTRSIISNMVKGVVDGYEKKLKIEGVGYQARMNQKTIVLTVGFANAIEMTPPGGVVVELPDPTTIVVRGADKQKVGQFAAEVRRARPPEPYKGKGIRYDDEVVRRKEGKSFASGAQ